MSDKTPPTMLKLILILSFLSVPLVYAMWEFTEGHRYREHKRWEKYRVDHNCVRTGKSRYKHGCGSSEWVCDRDSKTWHKD